MSLHCLFPLPVYPVVLASFIRKGGSLSIKLVLWWIMPLHSFLQTCLRFESFDVKTPKRAFDRTGWLFGPSSVFPLSLSVGCFAFLFASHFALTYISVFWIGDDFRSISLCLALSHHLTICPFFLLIYAWRCSCSHLIAHLLKKYLSSPVNHTIPSTICSCWLWKKKRNNSTLIFISISIPSFIWVIWNVPESQCVSMTILFL